MNFYLEDPMPLDRSVTDLGIFTTSLPPQSCLFGLKLSYFHPRNRDKNSAFAHNRFDEIEGDWSSD